MKKTYKCDDRVIYVSNRHTLSKSNPLWGSSYGKVVGTVVKVKGPVITVFWDNDTENTYRNYDLKLYRGDNMIEKAKSMAESVHKNIKPYGKYIGLIALAAVIDHFMLGGKFRDRFTKMAEGIVAKITDTMDKFIEKLDVDKEEPVAEKGGEA
jgi:hypothetical protein